MAIDPVCKMEVDEKKAAGTYEYKGKKYCFCAAGCRQPGQRSCRAQDHDAPAVCGPAARKNGRRQQGDGATRVSVSVRAAVSPLIRVRRKEGASGHLRKPLIVGTRRPV